MNKIDFLKELLSLTDQNIRFMEGDKYFICQVKYKYIEQLYKISEFINSQIFKEDLNE